MSGQSDESEARKRIAAVVERMRDFSCLSATASRELVRKWAREIEASLKREDA